MILYPAIDLKDGQAVRLYKGEMDQATVFNDSPADQALAFEQAGCGWIHLVDLNGAFAGTPVNDASVREILSSVSVPCQLGGGIRDMATIAAWIDLGLSRVILGTVAVENPALVREAAKAFPGKIAVGLDARDGRWRPVAGPQKPILWSQIWPNSSNRTVLPRLFIQTLTAMAPWAGRISPPPKIWRAQCPFQ